MVRSASWMVSLDYRRAIGDYCQHLSAYLVRVETLAENDFLKDLLSTTQAGNAWIGLTDQEHEGIWKWIDTDIPATFSDWGPGEPNNYQGQNEECVYFYSFKDYMWNDGMCHHKAVPLCEKD
ncbi:perlucin-like protein [Ruditapes philippinarum]|uniref:perlucin-like protein n=1 Tax=Ruditapes philippinarum TaxID=129788 RepID=UPI00295B88D5|nr:perlucin-like protein [Ruditapes philippinarum]